MAQFSKQRNPVISAQNVHKSYDFGEQKIHVLHNVNFQARAGEMVAIIGSSGSGKTTFLNCLSALDSIDSGSVEIENVNIHKMSDARRAKYRALNMSFIFQSFNLIPVLTAYENVEMPLLLSKYSKNEIKTRTNEALKKVGLSNRIKHFPSQLSGGQAQRVAIARAIAGEPKIVWADEPTGNLDTKTGEDIISLMVDLKEQGLTFIVVTHDLEIAKVCDRILYMRDGKLSTGEQST
jgi:putative ABC transport system ATP-binding protein